MSKLEASFHKASRAAEHINSLASQLRATEIGDGYFFAPAPTATPALILHFIQATPLMGMLIGEALYQMRSSLDLALVDLSLANDPTCNVHRIELPTDKSAADRMKKMASLTGAQQAYLESNVKAYEGGDALLHWMNGARNIDVHIQALSGSVTAQCSNMTRINPALGGDFAVQGELVARLHGASKAAAVPIATDGLAFDVSGIGRTVEELAAIANRHLEIAVRFCFVHPDKQKRIVLGSDPVLPKLASLHCRVVEVLQGLSTA